MIKYTQGDKLDTKLINKACKKLKLDPEGVKFVAYDKFFFAFVFALAIKDKHIHLFASGEDGKKEGVYSSYPLSKVKEVKVVNKTDVNLYLTNNKFINLTFAVGVKKSTKKIISSINSAIKNSK